MRPGQGNRRSRRNGGGHPHSHGGQGHPHQHSRQPRSAMQLRNQIFDSNGPDIRVRGNAYQVHEKYLGLAKDAMSSGDRVLAENYLQHAEHYFRLTEAINEAAAAEQRQRQVAYGEQPMQQPMAPQQPGNGFYNSVGDMGGPQGGAQTLPNNLRQAPVTMGGDQAQAPNGMGEGEDDLSPLGEGLPSAAMGRR